MKRTLLILLMGLSAVAWTVDADAGWLDRREKQRRRPDPHRFADAPRRSLLVGELSRGSRGEWLLGERALQLLPGCRIRVEGSSDSTLIAGRRALVLGTRVGDTILARQIRLRQPVPVDLAADNSRYGIVWSEVNPHVGVGTTPVVE